ncbi:aminodeoxychorismate synthase, glutamine amidotransferase subunit / aminodeoxychorismate synthase, subunit I [Rhodopseudomonas palustris BisB5]|uniref:aminodeoxychorismate synthase n=1 Tax=Rhodopseudomonas palustris (strain BisB5) TaxID=316057 RepID=Q135W4_RHOPS|nr:aminodeoxychorismate synthase, glutamine amidotransferase subunit / aminodeoxychorismate synthase, subunit I [Rhodopseudomonas palustris BisB5]
MRTLIIDNYDSFTRNLAHLVAVVNQEEPIVVRNDELDWDALTSLIFDSAIISPGPGHPTRAGDFGICQRFLNETTKPVLGVCLGHQGIAAAAGGQVSRAPQPIHGEAVPVRHAGAGLFHGIPSPFLAARYNSLSVHRPLPADLVELAWSEDGLVMGLMHRQRPQWGVQFHPESIITEHGDRLLRNFRDLASALQPRLVSGFAPAPQRPAAPRPRIRLAWTEIRNPPPPAAAFPRLFADKPCAFWLDSSLAEPGRARWSYFGAASGDSVAREADDGAAGNLLDDLAPRLRSEIDNPPPCPFTGGWVGYLGYELGRDFGGAITGRSPLPDVMLQPVDRFIAFDHQHQRMYAVCVVATADGDAEQRWLSAIAAALQAIGDEPEHPPQSPAVATPVRFRLDRDRDRCLADISQCLDWIGAGETYQVCLTNSIRTRLALDPLALYRVLRSINPAPYAAYFAWPGGAVLSASPERFLKVDNRGMVEAQPIKGTIRRDPDPIRDAQLARELAGSAKDRAENVMIVDLLRNDLSRVCRPGSVVVPKLCDVESYATVHQLVSTVRGELQPDNTVIDLIRAAFPGGSMTGAPKTRTLALIDQLERRARGVYSGALGWFGFDGAADLSIVIRTIVQSGDELSFGVGAGIVAQSTPEGEFDEMMLKAQASIRAIVTAATGGFADELFEVEGIAPRTNK